MNQNRRSGHTNTNTAERVRAWTVSAGVRAGSWRGFRGVRMRECSFAPASRSTRSVPSSSTVINGTLLVHGITKKRWRVKRSTAERVKTVCFGESSASTRSFSCSAFDPSHHCPPT
eukprot:701413-Rhodomonas_salina.2